MSIEFQQFPNRRCNGGSGVTDEIIPYNKVLQICDNAGVQVPVSAETHNPDRSVINVEMSKRVVDVTKKA